MGLVTHNRQSIGWPKEKVVVDDSDTKPSTMWSEQSGYNGRIVSVSHFLFWTSGLWFLQLFAFLLWLNKLWQVQDQKEKDKDCPLFVSHGVTVTMYAKLSLRPKQNGQNSGVASLCYLRPTSGAMSQWTTPAILHILLAGLSYIQICIA
jgi:hypothetical protein